MKKLWGGRFEGGLDPFFDEFNRSLPFDRRLIDQDLVGSIAWAEALGAAGVLTEDEVEEICRALNTLRKDVVERPKRVAAAGDEDVHSFVERELGALVGDLAKKLHTGRSRNDQVATDVKLWLREAGDDIALQIANLQRALVALADRYADLPVRGYTHLQPGQPVTAGHHAMAYVEMLARDYSRLTDAMKRADRSPLGCAALGGTAFPINRGELAKRLEFSGGPTRNSLDTVSDRDHVVELLFTCSLCLVHLSRLCEDWIFLSTREAGMLQFSDLVATGSSLMPQKRNPDALELIRGKAGRVTGHLQGLMMTLKGLPLAYNKDMQEDKEGLFDGVDTTVACLKVMTTVVETVEYDEAACRRAASSGYLNATDLADLLVQKGVPFRDAHERVGVAVRKAIELGCELEELPIEVRREMFPSIADRMPKELAVEQVLARRRTIGGTAPVRVRAEVAQWQKRLAR